MGHATEIIGARNVERAKAGDEAHPVGRDIAEHDLMEDDTNSDAQDVEARNSAVQVGVTFLRALFAESVRGRRSVHAVLGRRHERARALADRRHGRWHTQSPGSVSRSPR